MVHHGNMYIFGRVPDYSFPEVDIAGMARAMGAEAHTIKTRNQLIEQLTRKIERPTVLAIKIDPQVRLNSERTAALNHFSETLEIKPKAKLSVK